MKKLLSVIVTLAMLFSCVAPNLVAHAAGEPALVITEAVSFDPAARDTKVEVAVSMANNPGFMEGSFFLCYDSTVFNVAEGGVALAVGEDYENDFTISYNRNPSSAVKTALEDAGIAIDGTVKAVRIMAELGDDYTGSDIAKVVLTVVDPSAVAEGTQSVYAVAATGITNADGDEFELAAVSGVATAAADVNTPVYEDKTFTDLTLYADTVTVNKGVTSVEVGIGLGGTNEQFAKYGINAARFFVIFPEELKLVSQRASEIFVVDGTAVEGVDFETITKISDRFPDDVKKACDNVGYDYSNGKGYWVTAMLDPGNENIYYQCKDQGYLAYLTFEVPADKVGTYDICVVAGANDIYSSVYETTNDNPSGVAIDFTVDHGAIKVIVANCEHTNVTTTGEESTCKVAGWTKTVCDDCGEVVEEKTLPLADHTPGEKVVTKNPTTTEEGTYEIRCEVCDEVVESGSVPVIDDLYFSVGNGSAKYGDTVKVPVSVSNNKSGMFIAALDIVYDGAALKFAGVEGGDIVPADFVDASEYEAGKTRIYFENNDEVANVVGDGVLCYVIFEIAYDDALIGAEIALELEAEADNIIDANGTALATVFESGKVTVEAREATIAVGKVEGAFGKEVLVPITVENNPGMFIFIADVAYDTSVLTFEDFVKSVDVFEDAEVICNEYEAGKVRVYIENRANADAMGNGTLINLKFTVADDADLVGEVADVTISAEADSIVNYGGEEVDYVLGNGSVTVADRAKIEVSDSESKYGKKTVVDFNIINNEGVFIVIFDVKYDTSVLTYDMIMGYITDNTYVTEYEPGVLRVYVEADENADIVGNCTLASVFFNVANDAALVGTVSPVTVELVEAINYAGEDVDLAMVDGSVTVLDRETIKVGEVVGEEAHEIKVPVTVTNNIGIWGAIVEYTFDPAVVEFVGVEGGLFETAEDVNYSVNGNTITVFVEGADIADVVDNGTLYSLVFKGIAADADTAVEATIVEIINANGEDLVDFVVEDGEISVLACDHSEEKITATVTKQPTIDEEGEITYTCDICGNVVKTEPIARLAKIAIGIANIDAGDTVVIPVELLDNKGVWSIGLEIAYDADALEFVGVESGIFNAVLDENVSVKDGVITIFVEAADLNDVTVNDIVLGLKFKTSYEVSGEFVLDGTLIVDNTINVNGDKVDYTVIDGAVTVEAHEHTPVVDEAVEATCTSTGLTEGSHCDVCDTVLVAQEEVPMKDHTPVVDEAVEATCTSTGLTEGSHCDVCDTVLVAQEEVPMKDHTPVVDEAVEATCTSTGLTEGSHCDVCGTVLVAQDVVPVAPHTEAGRNGYAADCYNDGLTDEIYCTVCGEVLKKSEVIPALGHDLQYTGEVVEPTCTEDGHAENAKCSRCGYEESGAVIPALGHKVVVDAAVEATCTKNGLTEGSHCERCNLTLVEQEIVPAKGHTAVTDEAVEATCWTTGLTEGSSCEVCGVVLVAQEVLPVKAHTEVVDEAVEATCWSTGLTEGSHCEDCGYIIVAQTVVEKVAHTEVADAAVDATCTSTGLTAGSHCDVCGHVIVAQTVVEKVAHTEVVDAAVDATCTKTGLTAGSHCDVCGEILVAQTVVEKLAHTEVADAAVDATCTKTGLTAGSHCDVCGEILVAQTVVEKLAHTEVADEAVDATCTKTGLTAGSHCDVCGEILVAQTVVEKLAHKEVADVAVDATCTESGLTAGSHCELCGGTIVAQELVPATGHNFSDEFTVDREPANGVDGEKSRHCLNGCGERTDITPILATFNVTVDGNATIEASGSKVTITTDSFVLDEETNYGYAFDYWVVVSENATLELDAEVLENSIVMPDADVVITSVMYLIGDTNGDGEIDSRDKVALQNFMNSDSDEYIKYYDVNGDGEIDSRDKVALAAIMNDKGSYENYNK